MAIKKHILHTLLSAGIFISISLLFLLMPHHSSSQVLKKNPGDSVIKSFVVIRNILLDGNHRTRSQTVLRELTFRKGDSVITDELMKNLETSRNQLMNTGLFHEVVINIKNWANDSLDISVSVKERWYILPLPAANLYDRNFNVWWVEHDHDLRWMQAGMHFYQKNLSGRNDELQATALFGLQRQFSTTYILPYFDYIQKHGMQFSASFTQSKNIAYKLDSNKELIFEDVNKFHSKVFQTSLDIFYKPKFNYRYTFTLGYKNSLVNDTIAELNPDYFLNGNTSQQYMYARFAFVRDYRDIVAYPLRGNYVAATITKLGFGLFDDIDQWEITAGFNQHVQLSRKWFFTTINKVKITFPDNLPYNMQRGLGYGNDYVAGYEYYAINGQTWGYAKVDLKREIFQFKIKSPPNNPLFKGANIPFGVYGKTFLNTGYVINPHSEFTNGLDNTLLLGGGVGLDLVLLYDTSLRFEYSINKKGEHGLFFHVNTYF